MRLNVIPESATLARYIFSTIQQAGHPRMQKRALCSARQCLVGKVSLPDKHSRYACSTELGFMPLLPIRKPKLSRHTLLTMLTTSESRLFVSVSPRGRRF